MSDDWRMYPCQMGPDRAWVMFDFGISKTINAVAPAQLLRIRIAFKQPREDGMPTREEFQQLCAIDEDVTALAQGNGALYVGRITVAGHRHFYVYTPEDETAWEPRLADLRERHRYEVASYVETDEQRNGYWDDLYPDEASWQVMKDMKVLEVLRKEGDDATISRQIQHWAYFPERTDADRFAAWAGEQGYRVNPVSEAKNGQFAVSYFHEGTMELTDITSHSIRSNRAAKEFRGSYDGWETPVCKGGATPSENESGQVRGTQPSADAPQGSWVSKFLGRWRKH
jgi:hypothetical protein